MSKRWFEVEDLGSGIYGLNDNGQDMIYLILGDEKVMVVDTGWGIGDIPSVVRSISDLPAVVVNTHVHPDHANGDYQFDEVYLGTGDVSELERLKHQNMLKVVEQMVSEHDYTGPFSSERWLNDKPAIVNGIGEGYEFDLGGRSIKVIEAPGHTPGSILFLDKASRTLFAGDTLVPGEVWMHLNVSCPLTTYLNSLEHIAEYSGSFDFILCGHAERQLDASLLHDLTEGARSIVSGVQKGEPYHTFAGDGLRHAFKGKSIIYREDNIR